jgi:hypothetical protein
MAEASFGLLGPSPTMPTRGAHRLHGKERNWAETNCYVDLWIELLHHLGLEPTAMLAFTLSSDFDGSQWTFLKPPADDLRFLYGVELAELHIWRPVRDHVVQQLEAGCLVTVEVDAFFLPDTVATSYRRVHTKSTIVPLTVDVPERSLTYLHNSALHSLAGDDFDGLLPATTGSSLPPYVERIVLDRVVHLSDEVLRERAWTLLRRHLERLPVSNPVLRMGACLARFMHDAVAVDSFYDYMFATVRSCGAAAELAADHLLWLMPEPDRHISTAASALADLAAGMKTLEFSLARAAHGRSVDITAQLATLVATYDVAMREFVVGVAAARPGLSA